VRTENQAARLSTKDAGKNEAVFIKKAGKKFLYGKGHAAYDPHALFRDVHLPRVIFSFSASPDADFTPAYIARFRGRPLPVCWIKRPDFFVNLPSICNISF
jgi:hypothetical protein